METFKDFSIIFVGLFLLICSALCLANAEVQQHQFVVCLSSLLPSLILSDFVINLVLVALLFLYSLKLLVSFSTFSQIKHFDLMKQIQATPVKRLCKTHSSITVNGMFPGPTLEVKDGDTLEVKVINKARYNVTIHW